MFSDQRLARQAELGLRAKPEVRDAIANGATAIRTADRVVFVANGRGSVVDEFRLDGVVRVVGRMAVPPPLQPLPVASRSPAAAQPPDPDVLEQLRKLGDLRKTGVLTDAEFEAKKAELLGRL
ncbi:MAG: SHOCT domain-containing protein [Solirubrobacteraceae bacterium]